MFRSTFRRGQSRLHLLASRCALARRRYGPSGEWYGRPKEGLFSRTVPGIE